MTCIVTIYAHAGGSSPWLCGGFSKAQVKSELWEGSKMAASRLNVKEQERACASRTEELGEITDTTLLPIAPRPDDIHIVVAGGPGTHSVYVPCFGNTRAVTREIVY
jgi:hypothetical protein